MSTRNDMDTRSSRKQTKEFHLDKELEERVSAALDGLRFGAVTLVAQDGKVIQIDRNEKIRLK